MAGKKETDTPLMKQYNALKAEYPDTILLFRVGDFYETFGQDAIEASRILGITLTKRGGGDENELAGFPFALKNEKALCCKTQAVLSHGTLMTDLRI